MKKYSLPSPPYYATDVATKTFALPLETITKKKSPKTRPISKTLSTNILFYTTKN
jgi:hypothetical protein